MRSLCIAITIVLMFIATQALLADRIYLKNGKCIEGVMTQDNKGICVKMSNGISVILQADEIDRTENTKIPYAVENDESVDIESLGTIPLSDLQSDLDKWFDALEPSRTQERRRLDIARTAARLRRQDDIRSWGSRWVKKGYAMTAIEDIPDVNRVLSVFCKKVKDDIDILSEDCRSCKGTGKVQCKTCRGEGTITKMETVKMNSSTRGNYTERKKVSVKCSLCKGSGDLPCKNVGWHTTNNRVRRSGGIERLVDLERMIEERVGQLQEISKAKEKPSVLVMRCQREGWFYIMLQILRQIERDVLDEGNTEDANESLPDIGGYFGGGKQQ